MKVFRPDPTDRCFPRRTRIAKVFCVDGVERKFSAIMLMCCISLTIRIAWSGQHMGGYVSGDPHTELVGMSRQWLDPGRVDGTI